MEATSSDENKLKRKTFTLKTKYEIIQQIERGVKQSDLCSKMNLSKSTVSSIWKEREKIVEIYERTNSSAKKIRRSNHDELDQILLKWFSQHRGNNITITGALLHAKAEELGSTLGNNFQCSRSWIDRFKKRHGIRSGKIVGKAAAVDMSVVNDWLRDKWPHIRETYDNCDIFNAVETGLFYNVTPDQTSRFKGEKCADGKLSKERITLFVAANITGTEKRRLLIIGNMQDSKYFLDRTLIKYASNERSFMTSDIFCAELQQWDDELKIHKRKILLLIDNCPAHSSAKNLNFIKLVFMPPNSSSKLQPLNQGVVLSLKTNYRHFLLSEIISNIDKRENKYCASLLDAVNFIQMAWENVLVQTIANCFRKAGFVSHDEEDMLDSEDELPLAVEWILPHEVENIAHKLVEKQAKVDDLCKTRDNDFEAYIHVDDDVTCREILTDDDIIASLSSPSINTEHKNTSDTGIKQEDARIPVTMEILQNIKVENVDIMEENKDHHNLDVVIPSTTEILQNVDAIRIFLRKRKAPQRIVNSFVDVENFIRTSLLLSKDNQI